MKRVTVFFYEPLALGSPLFAQLERLTSSHKHAIRVGPGIAFGAAQLTDEDARALAARIAFFVWKFGGESVTRDFRLIVQDDPS